MATLPFSFSLLIMGCFSNAHVCVQNILLLTLFLRRLFVLLYRHELWPQDKILRRGNVNSITKQNLYIYID